MSSSSTPPQLSAGALSCRLPDGRLLFSNLVLGFGRELTGLIGANGVGKSMLARALAGESSPVGGRVDRRARVGWLPQDAWIDPDGTLATSLGVAAALSALERLDAGTGTAADLELVGAGWDLPARITTICRTFGLSHLALHRPIGTLSGGESTRVKLAALVLAGAEFLILDEPTNHLDAGWRTWLAEWLVAWPHGALVVSHDRALLERMDRLLELKPGEARWFGGGWSAFEEARAVERAAAVTEMESALAERDRARATVQRTVERQAKRTSRAARAAKIENLPPVLLGARKERSEKTASTLAARHARVLAEADARVAAARARQEELQALALSVPRSELHAGAMVLAMHAVTMAFDGTPVLDDVTLEVRGPERVAIVGANGSGKSTLLNVLDGTLAPTAGQVRVGIPMDRVVRLDQHARLLPGGVTVLEAATQACRGRDDAFMRLALARFGFRADAALAPVDRLSGGERMRVALCAVLHAEPAPQLLLLDEPTNHLDLASVEVVEAALRAYDGALLLVSHDAALLDRVGIDRRVALARGAS